MAVLKCTFCGKSQQQVRKLIAGPTPLCICDGCIELCNELIAEEELADPTDEQRTLPKPKEIVARLDQDLVGQDDAKRTLAVAVYNHYKRIREQRPGRGGLGSRAEVEVGKSNILLIGPTGSGKTYLAQSLARLLDVPFAIADSTALTEAGYVGEDVENILLKLIQAADYDLRKAETGIIYLDEVDKIARKSENASITRDVSGEGVQQALLKIMEGTTASVPPQGGRKHPHQEFLQLDTTNILFIAGGAFAGLEQVIQRRTRPAAVGFGLRPADGREKMRATEGRATDGQQPASGRRATGERLSPDGAAVDERPTPQDLMAFGLIPEFVGRLPVVASLSQLDQPALVRILTEPRNALVKQYCKLLRLDGVELEFSADAVEAIADLAILRRTGARALRAILEEVLQPVMYDIPSRDDVARVLIDRETVLGNVNPTLVPRDRPRRKRTA